MLPREFVARFGQPTVRTLTVPTGSPRLIGADPDRYLIAFFAVSGGMTVTPDTKAIETAQGYNMTTSGSQLIYSLFMHGAMPTLGYKISFTGAGSAVITVLEGYMRPGEAESNSRKRDYNEIKGDFGRGRSDKRRGPANKSRPPCPHPIRPGRR